MTGVRDVDRAIYDLLVNKHPDGLSRDQLLDAINRGAGKPLDDRGMRESVERVRMLAATNAHRTKGYRIVGFDPGTKRYVDAQTPDQAVRVAAYYHARIKSEVDGLNAILAAYQNQFGELPPEATDMQGALFDADRIGRRVAHAMEAAT